MVSTVVQDVVFALRLHRRRLWTVITVTGALAMAIGLATATVSVMNGVLFRQVVLADEPLLRWVDPTPIPNQASGMSVIPLWTYAEFLAMEGRTGQSELAGYVQSAASLARTAGAGDSQDERPDLPVWFVSDRFFDLVGAPPPTAGRWLMAADQTSDGPAAVVIGHAFWSRQLDADTGIVGSTLRLNGRLFVVAGIGPAGFAGPTATQPAFWAPLAAYDRDWRDGARLAPSSDVPVRVLARLPSPDLTPPAESELRSLVAGLPSRQPVAEGAVLLSLAPLDLEFRVGSADQIAPVVAGVLALLLLLACGNVANLLLASGATRRGEIATRLALGASRRRIIRQLSTEGLVLMLGAATAGWVLAGWLAPLLASLLEGYPTVDVRPDGRALAFLIGASTAIGLLASLMPAIFGSRGDLRGALGGGPAAGSPRLQRIGAWVVGGQAALSVVLILLAVLLTRAAWRGGDVDPGFDADRIATALALTPFMAPDEARATKLDIVARLRAVPGIQEATVARFSPIGGSSRHRGFTQDGTTHWLVIKPVAADYFRVVGITIRSGRTFADPAGTGGSREAVIEERLARQFWGDADPIGTTLSRLRPDLADVRVVGVASNVLPYRLTDHGQNASALYMPLTADDYRLGAVIIRTATSPARVEAIRQALEVAAPGRRANINVMGDTLRAEVDHLRTPARLASLAAVAVVGLAVIGIYGLAAYRVRQRVREIGVRMALGATPADVIRGLLQDGLRPIILGAVAGIGLGILALRLVSTLLLGLSTYDPLSLAASTSLLLVAAAVAIATASRRAARLSPSVALRHE